MIMTWSLPVCRQPVWLETFINDVVHQVQIGIDRFISRNEMLVQCVHYDLISAFTVSIIVSVIWILVSHFSS